MSIHRCDVTQVGVLIHILRTVGSFDDLVHDTVSITSFSRDSRPILGTGKVSGTTTHHTQAMLSCEMEMLYESVPHKCYTKYESIVSSVRPGTAEVCKEMRRSLTTHRRELATRNV
jgi:hypothetical protein